MTTLKFKEIKKMTPEDIKKKLKNLRLELVKSKSSSAKGVARTKEIKKIIARILTFNNSMEVLDKK